MLRKAAGIEEAADGTVSTIDGSYDNGKPSNSRGTAAFAAIMLLCFALPVCLFFFYSSTAPGVATLLRGSPASLEGTRGLTTNLHLETADGVSGLASASSLALASSQAQTFSTAPKSWRHPLQQDPDLPAGPEQPAPTPAPVGSCDQKVSMVHCNTTAGPITIAVHQDWAPYGASRFLEMVRSGFFSTHVALFRAVRGFLCQTGIPGDPAVHKLWQNEKGDIRDDRKWLDLSVKNPMKRGYLSFAGTGPDSRTTEFFFAFRDIPLGHAPWEVPFGTLVGHDSFETMDHWYTGYGDIPQFGGKAPSQKKMYKEGLPYLQKEFPEMDYITGCGIAEQKPSISSIPGYKTTYMMLREGSGAAVQPGNRVTVHATGVVQQTGKKFWSTKDHGQQPFSYNAGKGQVITGWDQGLLCMRKGEERKIIIPADEGYGKHGFPAWGIPPGATLEFTLEVLNIIK